MSVRDIIQAAGGVTPTNAWDLDYASFQGIVRSGVVADSAPTDVKFNADGTLMYVIGQTRDTVLQYDLSTPYQPSTALFRQKNVQSLENATAGVEFKPDGTKMYVIGTQGDDVNEFNLSIAWDVTTATFVQSKAVAGGSPLKVRFKDDGTRMYTLSNTSASVYQYNLSSAWDVSTATLANTYSVSSIESEPYGLFIGDSGAAMYVTGFSQDTIFRFTLSTPWDLSTASYGTWIAPSGSTAGYETTPTDVKFSSDGTKMYVLGTGADAVIQYNLSTAYLPSTGTLANKEKSVAAQETDPNGVEFKTDGTKMYIIGTAGDDINEYSLSTAWDVTTASFTTNFSVAAQTGTSPTKVRFKDDGTKMYVLSLTNTSVYQYSLSIAWDVSSATYDSVSFSVGAQDTLSQGLFFGDSGTKMYMVGTNNDAVYQYTLSSAWDLSTATYSGLSVSVAGADSQPRDVFFKDDGTKMYIVGDAANNMYQFSLGTAWNVSTASSIVSQNPSLNTWTGDGNPYGCYFRSNGLVMYVVGLTTDTVYQQYMSVAWDINTLSPFFSVRGQEGTPNGLSFKSDGTKMYVVGTSNDTVYQYSLSTAWDTFTASYDSVSFSVAGQETEPRGITFKTDGTKMYIIGSTGDDINEYALSVAWDISSASFTTTFSVATQTGAIPQKVEFSSDGTKMIVLSQTNGAVYQYNLSSAWDISTASYSSTSFPIATSPGETTCTGLAFADSGTKMYMIGQSTDRVWGFPLSSGWTLSSVTGNYKPVFSEDTEPRDVFFKTDGTVMYMLGGVGDDVNQYALSTAWDLYTASYTKVSSPSLNTWFGESLAAGMFISSDGKNFYACGTNQDTVFQQGMMIAWDVATLAPGAFIGGQAGTPNGVGFKTDGTKMYVLDGGAGTDSVYQYTLSTAWNTLTASYEGISFSVAAQEGNPQGLAFKDDGTKMYVVGASGNVREYTLNTAWNVSTASYVQAFSVAAQAGAVPSNLAFDSSGSIMYILSTTNNAVYQYNLSSAWNISTASYASVSYPVGTVTGETSSTGLAFADSGTKMYMIGTSTDRVWGFVLGTAWNLATTNSYYRNVGAEETAPASVTFKPDGTEMYVLGSTGDDVNQYSVSTAWQVDMASFVRNRSVAAQTGAIPTKVQFKDDGTKMYVLSATNDAIYQYSLSTAWDISTATYDSVSFSVTSQEATPNGMFFGDSGTKLYVVGIISNTVFQYTLSSAWDLSTASYANKSFSVVAQETQSRGVFIGNNGSTMYVAGSTNDAVYQYTLSTPWDVSTATYASKSFSVVNYEPGSNAIWFKDNGLSFYVTGTDNDILWQFTIS